MTDNVTRKSSWLVEKAVVAVVVLVIVGLLSVSAGVMVVPVHITSQSAYLASDNPSNSAQEDYPCRGHGCGCVTARICRTACCCVQPVAKSACHVDPAPPATSTNTNSVKPEDQENQTVWVLRSASCAGFAAQWILKSFSAIPPSIAAAIEQFELTFEVQPAGDLFASGIQPDIDPPPPRIA